MAGSALVATGSSIEFARGVDSLLPVVVPQPWLVVWELHNASLAQAASTRFVPTGFFHRISSTTGNGRFWLIGLPIALLLHRRVQLLWLAGVCCWSFLVRIVLSRGLVLADPPQLFLLAENSEAAIIERAWMRIPHYQLLQRIDVEQLTSRLQQDSECCLLTVGSRWLELNCNQPSFQLLKNFDPRRVQVLPPAGLFERQQERLPPILLTDGWMVFDEIPWAQPFSLQTQLKRLGDLVFAASLLLITSPLLLVAMLIIWMMTLDLCFISNSVLDGWATCLRFLPRTMTVQPANAVASWTSQDDQRITRSGKLLRRLRIDELPQLINVLKGEMSLIVLDLSALRWRGSLNAIFLIIECVIGCAQV